MVSVETTRRHRQAERRPGFTRAEAPGHLVRADSAHARAQVVRVREPSAEAVRAKASFDALSGYFRDRSQLRRALAWTAPTMRAWEGGGPSRPRTEHIERVRRLLEVARAAHEWVHDDAHRVGSWLIAPNDAIDGLRPAAVVRKLGDEGVSRLHDGMHQIAPRTPAHEHVDLSPEKLRDALDRLGLAQPQPAPPVEVDLSDFDDQNTRSA